MTRKRLLELLDDAKAVLDINGTMNMQDKQLLVPLLVALVQKDKPEEAVPLSSGFPAERARKLGPAPRPTPMQEWTTDPTKGRTPTDGGQP